MLKRLVKWAALGVAAVLGVVLVIAASFWFTVPASPTLADDFAVSPDTSVLDSALRVELLRMEALDQAVRSGPTPDLSSLGGMWRAAQGAVRYARVDGPNTERLKQIVANSGWPTRAEVGADGRQAVFLIVQHADRDPDFQASALEPMREAYRAGDADGSDLALLTDRVRVAQGRPQIYGSQLVMLPGEPTALRPIEDEANVDVRRAGLGMESLDEYLASVCAETGFCVQR